MVIPQLLRKRTSACAFSGKILQSEGDFSGFRPSPTITGQPRVIDGLFRRAWVINAQMKIMVARRVGSRSLWTCRGLGRAGCGVAFLLLGLTGGCDRDKIRVYRVAKEPVASPTATASHTHEEGEAAAVPRLTWT